jgi:hypothetical protein
MISSEVGRRLESAPIAWFSSVRPDHSPHTVPVWFVHDNTHLWVASSSTSRKVVNVRSNPQVALAIDGSAPRTLVAQARAETLDVVEHPYVVAGFAEKYHGFDITAESVARSLVLMRLTITRWLLDGSPQ